MNYANLNVIDEEEVDLESLMDDLEDLYIEQCREEYLEHKYGD